MDKLSDEFFKDLLAEHEIELTETEIEPAPTVTPEWIPQPRIQRPHREKSDPATFKVGTWEWQPPRNWIRLALPHPRYPSPGALATDEVAHVYDAECALRLDAEIVLRQYLWYVKFRALYSDYHNEISHGLAAERIAWLRGVWNSRGIRCPEPDEFLAMAIEPEPKGGNRWHTDGPVESLASVSSDA